MECRRKFNRENLDCFSKLKSADLVLIAQIAAASSNGLVKVVYCKVRRMSNTSILHVVVIACLFVKIPRPGPFQSSSQAATCYNLFSV